MCVAGHFKIAPLEPVGFLDIKLLCRRPLHPSPLAPAPAQASALSSAQVHFALEMPSSAQASAQCSMIRVHRTVYLPGPKCTWKFEMPSSAQVHKCTLHLGNCTVRSRPSRTGLCLVGNRTGPPWGGAVEVLV